MTTRPKPHRGSRQSTSPYSHEPKPRQEREDGRLPEYNHNGHAVTPGIKPAGESGRRGFHPLHFFKVCWNSSCTASKYVNVLWPFVPAAIALVSTLVFDCVSLFSRHLPSTSQDLRNTSGSLSFPTSPWYHQPISSALLVRSLLGNCLLSLVLSSKPLSAPWSKSFSSSFYSSLTEETAQASLSSKLQFSVVSLQTCCFVSVFASSSVVFVERIKPSTMLSAILEAI